LEQLYVTVWHYLEVSGSFPFVVKNCTSAITLAHLSDHLHTSSGVPASLQFLSFQFFWALLCKCWKTEPATVVILRLALNLINLQLTLQFKPFSERLQYFGWSTFWFSSYLNFPNWLKAFKSVFVITQNNKWISKQKSSVLSTHYKICDGWIV
jgi:hypothetical protein